MAKGIGQFSEEIDTSSLSAVAIPSYCRGLDLHVVAPPYKLNFGRKLKFHYGAIGHSLERVYGKGSDTGCRALMDALADSVTAFSQPPDFP